MVLPAAIITFLLYAFGNELTQSDVNASYELSILKILPYLFIFAAALLGLNVIGFWYWEFFLHYLWFAWRSKFLGFDQRT
jgi:Na+/H+ antiporter NhaC